MVCVLFCIGESLLAYFLVHYLGLPAIVSGSVLGILIFSVGILFGFWLRKFLKNKNEIIDVFIGNVLFSILVINSLIYQSVADIKISIGALIGFSVLSTLYSLKYLKILKVKSMILGIIAIILAIIISFIFEMWMSK